MRRAHPAQRGAARASSSVVRSAASVMGVVAAGTVMGSAAAGAMALIEASRAVVVVVAAGGGGVARGATAAGAFDAAAAATALAYGTNGASGRGGDPSVMSGATSFHVPAADTTRGVVVDATPRIELLALPKYD
jgi:hypothetical protein